MVLISKCSERHAQQRRGVESGRKKFSGSFLCASHEIRPGVGDRFGRPKGPVVCEIDSLVREVFK